MKEEERNIEALLRKISLLETHVEELKQSESALKAALSRSKEELEELKKADAWHHLLADTLNDVMWTQDLNLRTLSVSPAIERVLGFTPEERKAQDVTEQITPELLSHIREVMAYELEREAAGNADPNRTITLDVEYYHKNGTTRWSEVVIGGMRNEQGMLIGIKGVMRDINDRKRVELAREALLKELRASEARYRFLVENASDLVWTFDLKTMTYDFISPSVERLLGFSVEEAARRTLSDTHPPEVRQYAIDAFMKLIKGGYEDDRMVIEAEHFHRDGSRVWMEISATAIRDDKGEVVGFSGVSRDISDRKRAEFNQQQANAALLRSEKNFRLSLDESPLGVRIVSQTGETLYVNRVLLDLFGYDSTEDWHKTAVADRYTAESYVDHMARKEKRVRGEEVPSEYEIEIVKKSSEVGHLQVWRKEIMWSGEPCFQLIYEDITVQWYAVKMLEASEERYRSILDDIEEGYFETDLRGNYTFINDALARMHKCTPEELYGMNYREYVTDEVAGQLFTIYNNVYRTGVPAIMENYDVITKDGKVQLRDMSVSLIRDATGTPSGYRGVARDVTERRAAEKSLQEAEFRYRTLADSGRALIWTSGRDKKRDDVNRTWLEFTGHSLDEDLGDGWMSSVHPEDLEHFLQVYDDAFDRRESFNITYRLRRYDGEYCWLLSEGTPRYDSSGNFLGYIAHSLDVTHQKAMEASIVKIRKSLDEAQKIAKIGSWEWERTVDEVYCSREFLRIVGVEEGTFQGAYQDFIELFHVDNRSAVSDLTQTVLNEGTQRDVEFSFTRRDGTSIEAYH